jgi:hypothetical protein
VPSCASARRSLILAATVISVVRMTTPRSMPTVELNLSISLFMGESACSP